MAKLTQEDLQTALPAVTGTLHTDGLDGPIDIYRDAYGIPHVQAQSVHDAFVGQGFATAQDRLWHMDADRHRAHGRWAELVGSPGVDADIMMRKMRVGATAKADYEASSPATRAMLDAYASGVNTFISTTQSLPVEYHLVNAAPTPWQPWDAFAVFKMRHILMGIFEGKLWRAKLVNTLGPEKAAELMTGYPPGQLVIEPPGAVYDGPLLNALETFQAG